MIGYICKYAPMEIFECMGESTVRIKSTAENFNNADLMMHPNVCSYIKGVLENVMENDYDGIVLTACCDSSRRLYDALKTRFPEKFVYIIDLPRMVNESSILLYASRIRAMITAYEQYSGKIFNTDALRLYLQKQKEDSEIPMPKQSGKNGVRVGILGARCSDYILQILRERGVEIAFNYTCTGSERAFSLYREDVVLAYSEALLSQIPCIRTVDYSERARYLDAFDGKIDGIIYHTVKFCDVYSFEYAQLHKKAKVPLLGVETDMTPQCEGQTLTRVEAFLEALETAKGINRKNYIGKEEDSPMYVLGIDSGSTSTNAVIMNKNREIVAFDVVRTGAKSGESAQMILERVLKKANLQRSDLALIVSTGYGRVSIPFADMNVTEISCHGKGAHYFNPAIRTILDIGGQDSKAIRLSENGEVIDFVMNDKCAAGTGRFLEMMARTLDITMDELGPISLNWKEEISITNMCSVFAESEVISLIAQNKEKSDIAHGLHNSIATRAFALMKRVGLTPEYMMTGGVAKNLGVVKAVEEKLGAPLYICKEPEIVGATGATLFGLESLEK